jgi:hypothetical protein
MVSSSTKALIRDVARVWVAVGLGMLVCLFAAWELAALIESVFLFNLFSTLYWLCPALGLAWTGVLVYRAARGRSGARAA